MGLSLSETFRKLFGLKSAELEAERNALQAALREQQAGNKALQEEIARLKAATPVPVPPVPPEPPAPEVTLAEVPGGFVEAAFQKLVGQVNKDGMPLFAYGREGMARVPLDAKYRLPATLADLEAMIAWGLDEDRKYAEDFYDCENYAVYLKGKIDWQFLCNGVGVVVDWTSLPGAHAYNVAMLADGTVLVIEPQDGNIYTLAEKSALYRALTGVMLF